MHRPYLIVRHFCAGKKVKPLGSFAPMFFSVLFLATMLGTALGGPGVHHRLRHRHHQRITDIIIRPGLAEANRLPLASTSDSTAFACQVSTIGCRCTRLARTLSRTAVHGWYSSRPAESMATSDKVDMSNCKKGYGYDFSSSVISHPPALLLTLPRPITRTCAACQTGRILHRSKFIAIVRLWWA